jgi:Protein of unknown function (DUF3150)
MSNALNDVIVVSLDVRIWSGRKKLRPEDLTASGRLPPKELVSLGSKKIFDPRALKPFIDVKRRAETRCQAIGVRFARAFAIPKAAAKSVIVELNDLAERFRQVRDAFLASYDEQLTRWKAQHPGYEHLIEAELLPKTWVGSKFAFCYDVFAINAVQGDDELAALMEQGGAGNLTQGLTGALYDEVASDSRQFIRQSLIGRHEVTQKFLRPVRAIRAKLAGLAFLDPGIAPLVGSIDEVLACTPTKGKIDGASLAMLRGVVTLLTDPAQMRTHGRMVLEGNGQGLLVATRATDEEVASEAAARPGQLDQGCDAAVPTTKTPRAQRASAFW